MQHNLGSFVEFGESVLGTLDNHGDKGVIDHWRTLYKHPSIGDYNKELLADQEGKATMDDKEHLLRYHPGESTYRIVHMIPKLFRDVQ